MKFVIEIPDEFAAISTTPRLVAAGSDGAARPDGALSGGAAPELATAAALALAPLSTDALSAGEAEQIGLGGGAMAVAEDPALDGGSAPD